MLINRILDSEHVSGESARRIFEQLTNKGFLWVMAEKRKVEKDLENG
jgi:hypothetical protein